MGCGGYSSSDIGKAFACTIAAGLATLIGSLVLWIAPLQNPLFVSAALAFAAGVLTFVSFIDILAGKSVGHFEDEGFVPEKAFALAVTCFFCGWPIAYFLDFTSSYFMPKTLKMRAEASIEAQAAVPDVPREQFVEDGMNSPTLTVTTSAAIQREHTAESSIDDIKIKAETKNEDYLDLNQIPKMDLLKMGMLAAVVIAAHNMPEGLVTFMAYLDDISSGITVAVAIAIHNIPEGIVVALPLYYATQSKLWAVTLSAMSAVTEPLGALIGLAVACTDSMNDTAFGVVFGLVAGIMVYISLNELLPMARRLDPKDKVSSISLVFGMMVIASSLIAIGYTAPTTEEVEDVVVIE